MEKEYKVEGTKSVKLEYITRQLLKFLENITKSSI